MSDTNRIRLSYIEEETFGVTPTGNLVDLRFTSESLHQETSTTSSQEIRSDRQVPDVIRTNLNAPGEIAFELSYGGFDDFLAAALMTADWSSAVTVTGTTLSAAAADNSFNDSGNGFGVFSANQWIKVSGFTGDAANNGFFKIVSVAAGKIVVTGGTLVNDSAGESVSIVMGAQIVNGTTKRSFSIERGYTDVSNVFSLFNGEMVNQFNLSVQPEQVITGSFNLMGIRETSATSTAGSGYTAAPTNDVMNAVDHVPIFLEGGSDMDITAYTLALANNLRNKPVVGTLGPSDIGTGSLNITGTVKAYFSSATLMNKYLNFTASSLCIVLKDSNGKGYVIELPRVKYTLGNRTTGGQNQDVIADLNYTAYRHPTEDTTIRIARFAA